MKHLILCILLGMLLTGCGNDPALSGFAREMNNFCDNLYQIDTEINSIQNISADEAGLKDATDKLLHNLELLDDEFKKFASIDFPTQYDYLEEIADEAGEYMTEALKAYQNAYEDGYTESMEEYAHENYARAYKRVQFILDVLHGKDPNAK